MSFKQRDATGGTFGPADQKQPEAEPTPQPSGQAESPEHDDDE